MPSPIGSRSTVPRAKPDPRRTNRSTCIFFSRDVTRRPEMYFLGCAGSETSTDAVQLAGACDRFRPESQGTTESVAGSSQR